MGARVPGSIPRTMPSRLRVPGSYDGGGDEERYEKSG